MIPNQSDVITNSRFAGSPVTWPRFRAEFLGRLKSVGALNLVQVIPAVLGPVFPALGPPASNAIQIQYRPGFAVLGEAEVNALEKMISTDASFIMTIGEKNQSFGTKKIKMVTKQCMIY